MIREAVADDIPRLVEMGQAFFTVMGMLEPITFDGETFSRALEALIEGDDGAVFVADEDEVIGFIGGMVFPLFFNARHLTGQEMFWWVDEDRRKGGAGRDLCTALEEWARGKGAGSFTMVALESLRPVAVAAIYERVGYKLTEYHFVRQFERQL